MGDPAELQNGIGLRINIFLDLNFTCEGKIKEWTLFVKRDVRGALYLSVWRETGLDQYNLVGYNRIQVDGIGPMTVTVSEGDRIRVQQGDCISTHFDDDDEDAKKGSIAVEDHHTSRVIEIEARHSLLTTFTGLIDLAKLNAAGFKVRRHMKIVALRASVGE